MGLNDTSGCNVKASYRSSVPPSLNPNLDIVKFPMDVKEIQFSTKSTFYNYLYLMYISVKGTQLFMNLNM